MPFAKIKRYSQRDPLIAIIISTIVSSALMVYPLSYELSGWRPMFMLLTMLFWVIGQPTWCGVWFAFGMGIFTDLLVDAPLGMNALIFVLIAFIARYLTRERRVMTFFNLWVIAALALVAHLFVTWLGQMFAGVQFSVARHWQPLLTSILYFPILYFVLKKWRI